MQQIDKLLTLPRLFFLALIVSLGILSIQLPFLYYSDDIVFHIGKIMSAKGGDFFTDPISGFQTIYPPFFHIIAGTMARVFVLDAFWTSRVVQLVMFGGMILSAFWFFVACTGSKERGAMGGLCMALLFYAPTGKYFLLHNPTNFSTMFVLAGAALLIKYLKQSRTRDGVIGVIVAGIGVNIWWWNIIPVGGLLLGIVVSFVLNKKLTQQIKSLLLIGLALAVTLAFSLWPLYEIRGILHNYDYDIEKASYAGDHSTFEILGTWVYWFLLKGNQQFFKYLVPATLSATDRIVFVYGIIASVYFYLLVLPFNYLMILFSTKVTLSHSQKEKPKHLPALFIAAVTVFLLSIISLYKTDPSVLRRIQFYAFIFLLPGFLHFLFTKFALDSKRLLKLSLATICALSLLYSVFYRNEIVLTNPRPPETTQLVDFVDAIPNHADTRFFVTEFDNHLLVREMRYHSFILNGNPIYFRQDKRQADSIFNGYNKIIACDSQSLVALKEFDTKYAIIGKSSFNISPIKSKITENELSDKMTGYFSKHGKIEFENNQWVVFKIIYDDIPQSS